MPGLSTRSVAALLRAIRELPEDAPVADPKKWYLTQKQHWIAWLGEYAGPGAYGRDASKKRDARFAYNHIVEPKMLLWLIEASGLEARAARRVDKGDTMMRQSAAIRKVVPWEEVEQQLWPSAG